MRKKVLDLRLDGFHIECIKITREGERNPFRVYRVAEGHKRQIAKYGDFLSVLCFIRNLYFDGADTYTMDKLIQYARETGSI